MQVAADGPDALASFEIFRPDAVFLDVKMQGMDGLEVLGKIREKDPQALVVMISGHGTIDVAVDATRRGAFDFLDKPLDTDLLLVTLRSALQVRGLSDSVEWLRSEIEQRHRIVGSSLSDKTRGGAGRAGRAHRCTGLDHRREWYGKRAGRAGHP